MDYWWRVYLAWFQVFYEYQEAKEVEAINRRQETFSYRLEKIERALQKEGIV
jgi:hypothetical protein